MILNNFSTKTCMIMLLSSAYLASSSDNLKPFADESFSFVTVLSQNTANIGVAGDDCPPSPSSRNDSVYLHKDKLQKMRELKRLSSNATTPQSVANQCPDRMVVTSNVSTQCPEPKIAQKAPIKSSCIPCSCSCSDVADR